MSSLISPGVSVTVTDESFYIPATASTVPLFFIATESSKLQPDGVSLAVGTIESNKVRTITSLGQSLQLFGVPSFRKNTGNQPMHGDARNEYGLFALNQYLGVGSLAYVIRADADLLEAPIISYTPTPIIFSGTHTTFVADSGNVGNGTMVGLVNKANPVVQTVTVTFTGATQFDVVASADAGVGQAYGSGSGTLSTLYINPCFSFTINSGNTAFQAGDEFVITVAVPGKLIGVVGNSQAIAQSVDIVFTDPNNFNVTASAGTAFGTGTGTVGIAVNNDYFTFTVTAGATPFTTGDSFTFDLEETSTINTLGADDAAKRVSIAAKLAAVINSNQDIRSDNFEFNIIICPGYPEVADEMQALSTTVLDEAFVVAETPFNKSVQDLATWAISSDRKNGNNIAYYYPHGLASNIDGADVFCAASGIALRTITYSDNVSEVWRAPAGIRRGLVTGVAQLGIISGTLGTATTFEELNLNQGQRDVLYGGLVAINPIVFFPGRGMIIWGQKTSASASSAFDRINVARLIMDIKRKLRKNSLPFLFEPNDQLTRDDLKAMADNMLADILIRRGLYDYATLCDASNNSPDRIDRNEMWMDIALKPTKDVEFIYIPIRVLTTGASMS